MNSFLLTLGGLTLGGSAAILLLALAGRLTRTRYGARWRCWVWAVLCLRLALPLSLFPQGQERAPVQVDIPAGGLVIQNPGPSGRPQNEVTPPPSSQIPSSGGDASGEEAAPPAEEPQESAPSLPFPAVTPALVLTLLWGLGAAGVLVWELAAHLRFLRWLRRWAAPEADSSVIRAFNRTGDSLKLSRRPALLRCPGLPTPMLAGLFRPVLLLPRDMAGDGLEFALLHELTHLRRRDIWLRALALWVRALYWFNPLCWLMSRLISRDTELACDEEVLGRLPPEEKEAYGRTILSASARRK